MKAALLTALLALVPALAPAEDAPPAAGTNPMAALAGMIKAFQGGNTNGAKPATNPDLMNVAAELMKSLQGGTNSPFAAMGGKPAIDFRELRALLPAESGGFERTKASGRTTGAFGASVSEASGEYGKPGGPRVEIKIVDLGGMGPLGAMAGMGWVTAQIDSESDDGYERTTEFKGRKGLEKYSTASKSGSAKVLTAGRFMVEIKGSAIEPAQLKTAAESVDFDALERLANRPRIE